MSDEDRVLNWTVPTWRDRTLADKSILTFNLEHYGDPILTLVHYTKRLGTLQIESGECLKIFHILEGCSHGASSRRSVGRVYPT